MQDLVTPGFQLDAAGDVLDGQHVAGHRSLTLLARCSKDRDHLDAQQLAATCRRDEIRNRRLAGGQALADHFLRMFDLALFEDRENRATKPDQRPAGDRSRSLRQRLELQPGTVVIEQDAAVEIAHDDSLGELRHQRRQAVFFFLNRSLGGGDLGIDIVHQHVALLRQVVGGLGQLLNFRRPFGRDTEIAVGAEHQAQGLGHPQQSLDILFEQLVQHRDTKGEADQRHHRADWQA